VLRKQYTKGGRRVTYCSNLRGSVPLAPTTNSFNECISWCNLRKSKYLWLLRLYQNKAIRLRFTWAAKSLISPQSGHIISPIYAFGKELFPRSPTRVMCHAREWQQIAGVVRSLHKHLTSVTQLQLNASLTNETTLFHKVQSLNWPVSLGWKCNVGATLTYSSSDRNSETNRYVVPKLGSWRTDKWRLSVGKISNCPLRAPKIGKTLVVNVTRIVIEHSAVSRKIMPQAYYIKCSICIHAPRHRHQLHAHTRT
jgi:hypothetical protein